MQENSKVRTPGFSILTLIHQSAQDYEETHGQTYSYALRSLTYMELQE